MTRNPEHPESGITDEAAIEGHDLIHNAEVEEQKLHGKDALTSEDPGPEQTASLKGTQKGDKKNEPSAVDKVKDASNMNK
ncbi:hypothetical protein G7046_g547 [Stylonectria norvegica]|nr:hypothetical protein G7046_g547 [Stylonectria norvegica]